MDFVFELQCEFDQFEFAVIRSYDMLTPPPSSIIIMPVFMAESKYHQIIFKESWVLEPDWTVSIKRNTPQTFDLEPFTEEIDPTDGWLLKGMQKEHIYDSYSPEAEKFTCAFKNKHLLYTLFYLLNKEITG